MNPPTTKQIEVALHVEGELMETVNNWIREGADPREIIAALAKTATDTIIAVYGPKHVAPWFVGMAVAASRLPDAKC